MFDSAHSLVGSTDAFLFFDMRCRKLKAAIFVEPNRIVLEDKPISDVGLLAALVRITTTTICGTDVHMLQGEYPVESGCALLFEMCNFLRRSPSSPALRLCDSRQLDLRQINEKKRKRG